MTTRKTSKNKSSLKKNMIAAHNRKVRRDNAKFDALSPADKRVAIAKDVILQLDTNKLIATTGTWLAGKDNEDFLEGKFAVENKNMELRNAFQKMEECTGCAIGGLFMCAVNKADRLKIKDLEGFTDFNYHGQFTSDYNISNVERGESFSYLRKFFTQNQLLMIEAAFERRSQCPGGMFAIDVEDDALRMKLIMENIIANKGKFCSEIKPLKIETWVMPK